MPESVRCSRSAAANCGLTRGATLPSRADNDGIFGTPIESVESKAAKLKDQEEPVAAPVEGAPAPGASLHCFHSIISCCVTSLVLLVLLLRVPGNSH